MARRADDSQLDLLAWEPPVVVRRFDPQRVKGSDLRARIARAVSEVLRACPDSREDIAAAMTDFLGERVTKSALDGHASTARSDSTITLTRLVALIHLTSDARPLQLLAEEIGHAVIEARWLAAVEDAQWADRAEEAKTQQKAARRRWKGGAR